jgi:tetraacyldisaccharide 4'-kinase
MVVTPQWLWSARTPTARLARAALLPISLTYRGAMALRARAYERGLLPRVVAPLPTVAVGNLTVGGSGKTPLAAWIASFYHARGLVPGIVLGGYGADEAAVHRRLVTGAIVVEDSDRARGIREAARRGAQVAVLDDAFQRLDVLRDLNVAVVSAESALAVRCTLPAGPWREGWAALRRADLVVVTRKRATRAAADGVLAAVARTAPGASRASVHLALGELRGLRTGRPIAGSELRDARVVCAVGIADSRSPATQLADRGASVKVIAYPDHHPYDAGDIRRLVQLANSVDYVVVTEKDAVKLEPLWPTHEPEPAVAALDVVWETGLDHVDAALGAVTTGVAALLA